MQSILASSNIFSIGLREGRKTISKITCKLLSILGCPTPEAANVIQAPEQDPLNPNIVTANLSAFQFDGSDQIYFDCVVEICGNYPDICVVVSRKY